jgi:hypothetical protein
MRNKAEEEYLLQSDAAYNPYIEEPVQKPRRPQTSLNKRARISSSQGRMHPRGSGSRARASTARPKKRRSPKAQQQQQRKPRVQFKDVEPSNPQEDLRHLMQTSPAPKILAQSIPLNQRSWDADKSKLLKSHQ